MKKFAVLLILIFASVANAPFKGTDLRTLLMDDCVAQWKMNDNAASTTVIDSVGSYDGTFNDATGDPNTSAHSVSGKINTALSFDGADDYVDTGNTLESAFQSDFTINLWSKHNLVINGDNVLGCYNSESGHLIWLFRDYTEDFLYFYYGDQGGYELVNLEAGYVNYDGVWAMITIIVQAIDSNSIGYLYINGTKVNDVDNTSDFDMSTLDMGSNNFCIGRNNKTSAHFNGSIDNVMIFNKALSQVEIDYLYSNGNGIE